MKEQADIAPKAGYHRHDDTLPLVVAVRGQRSDICWTSIVLLLESVCPKPCWNRVRQTGNCKFLYYHIFKTCFAFALTNWIIGPEMITVISVHTPNFPPNKTPVTTTKISNAIRTNLICQ